MKVRDLPLLTTTQTELARAIGVTQPYISQLVKSGIVVSDKNDKNGGVMVFASLKNYYSHTAPASNSSDDVDINLERAKREAAERKIAELKLAKMENRVYDARVVELVQTEMLSNLRTQLLGLPTKIAGKLPESVRAEVYELLTQEIEEKLGELAEYEPEQYTQEEIGDGDEE